MKFSTMRRLDDWVGVPLCFISHVLASISNTLNGKRPGEVLDGHPGNILIIKFLGMGSIILAADAVRGLRRSFPSSKIIFLTFWENQEIVQLLGLADELLYLRTSSFWLFCWDLGRVLWTLGRNKPDICVDMEFFSRFSLLMTWLSRSRIRVGFHLREPWRAGPLLTHKVFFNPYRHITEVFSALFRGAGSTADQLSSTKTIIIRDEATTRVERYLREAGRLPSQKLVVLNPNAGDLSLMRRWPADRFIDLAKQVRLQYDVCIVFIGAVQDKEYVKGLMVELNSLQGVIDLSGRLSLMELGALFKLSSLLISNDSGPLHLAGLFKTPAISLFGPESPHIYGPRGNNHAILYKSLYCSPCLNVYTIKKSGCLRNSCLMAISVEDVLHAIKQLGALA